MSIEESPNPNVDEIEREIIRRIGSLSKNLGLGELIGLLGGTLVLHMEEPVSLEYLTEATRYSKSSVSTTMRTLTSLGFFESVKIEGDRRRYYMIKGSFKDILIKSLNAIIEVEVKPMISLLNDYIPLLNQLSHAAPTKKEQEKAKLLLKRVQRVKSEYESFMEFLLHMNECARKFQFKK